MMFQAIYIQKNAAEQSVQLRAVDEKELPDAEVQLAVSYSCINYKDALAITGKSPIVRQYPMVPGIDLAGEVLQSNHADFNPGDQVILNGWGVGEKHWGGLAQRASVNAAWLQKCPTGLTAKQTMQIGTAGYTAMLCILALEENGVTPQSGDVLVTGAVGGVGSIAVQLLNRLGYRVVAMTGRKDAQTDFLKRLGAHEVIDRSEYSAAAKPLAKERWAGAVDVVGSHVLANICSSLQQNGVVAACGLAAGMDLPTSVAPFILRGIRLIGINSVLCPQPLRIRAWQRLEQLIDTQLLDEISQEINLAQAIDLAEDVLAGRIKGRLLVNVNL